MALVFRPLFVVLAFFLLAASPAGAQQTPDPEHTLVMQLKDGPVVIELLPEVAPNHVARIKELARDGFYDGLTFHRVIDGFMAQTGDPRGDGTGGSELPDLRAEFSNQAFTRGALGMARSSSPNSANSQWFICFVDCYHLDGQYTLFGRVVDGMQYVDNIKKAPSWRQSGRVDNPDKIISLDVQADIQ